MKLVGSNVKFNTSHPTQQRARGPPAILTPSVQVFNKEVVDEVPISEPKEGGNHEEE